jgi:nitroimidazol reductase NimA-like FMN-containing flavoprotein (pyridoxamine 5'-phosphate oxidase superfamily)
LSQTELNENRDMLGKLSDKQIDLVLHAQMIGRIGCYADGKVFITPVTYVYHEGYVYAHSKDGHKVQAMRNNPIVCFQVDAIENMRNWRSAIVWGEYEELTEEDQRSGMKIMVDRLAPFMVSETVSPTNSFCQSPLVIEKGKKVVAYRIRVTEKEGRFEKA